MAVREARSGRKQIGLYSGAIALGVAALVAIISFRADVAAAIHQQARGLLGADMELRSSRPFPEPVQAVLDSLEGSGTAVSYITSFTSMVLAPRTGRTRLVDVRAVAGEYPYYGTIETHPAGRWGVLRAAGRLVLADPSGLVYLDAGVGDTLRIGDADFVVAAALERIPGEVGIQAAIGPRVYIPAAHLQETNLLRFGSRARYAAYLNLGDGAAASAFIEEYEDLLEEARVRAATAADREESLAEYSDALGRFLGLVGLMALLLGGVATASAVNVYVKRKLNTVAVLRCLGASQRTVFAVYLLQAVLIGLAGSAIGIAIGLLVERSLPGLLADFLPLEVGTSIRPGPVLAGLGLGLWVALAFGVLPLLTIRGVAPLRALRRGFDAPARRIDVWRVATYAVLGLTVLGLCLSQAPVPAAGLAFAIAITVTMCALWVTAWALMRATHRFFPRRAPYVVRQGVANLFRPHNQTVSVTLTVGFGVFLLGSLDVVQRNILDQLAFDMRTDRPNLVVFDVQPDQVAGVERLLRIHADTSLAPVPMVPSRIAAINERSVDSLLRDTTGQRPSRWALRREYRNTYRDTVVNSETVVAGEWWHRPTPTVQPDVVRISIEESLAEELRVDLGDHITWDVQGVTVESEIASVRTVDWARFEPNFFVVFEPGALEQAPQTFVMLTHVGDLEANMTLQRELVVNHPNVSVVDLRLVQETIDTVVQSVTLAVRVMALFSIVCGIAVLIAAVATSRYERLRENVLLKTLGAETRQVVRILGVEYLALGSLAAVSGIVLAGIAGWAATRFLFDLRFSLPLLPLAVLGVGACALTTIIGFWGGRDLANRPPLAMLREIAE
jgi:putative ABC transport system permease protein